ncbi:MAG: DUF1570 domain-containing protein [Phycisphaerae bacterium]|nr:DUF1570 domain-containing protein [Phycisphaerae bacterium]
MLVAARDGEERTDQQRRAKHADDDRRGEHEPKPRAYNGIMLHALVLTMAALVQDPAAAALMPPIPDALANYMPKAERHASDHFLVVSDAPPAAIANTLNALERTRTSLLADLAQRGLPATDSGVRHLAILFSDEGAFRRFAREVDGQTLATTLGYYQPSHRRLQLFDPESTDAVRTADATIAKNEAAIKARQDAVNRMRSSRLSRQEAAVAQREVDQARAKLASQRAQREAAIDNSLKVVVVHEATHQVLFESGAQSASGLNPLWLAEGLAVAYETDDVRRPGGPTSMRDERFATFRPALLTNGLMPVRLLVTTRVLPSGGGTQTALQAQADFYAQSCMFVRWCMLERPAEFKALLAACRSAKPGDAPETIFESCFGSIDAVQRSYVLWLREQIPESEHTDALRAAQSWSIDGRQAPAPTP